MSYSDRRTLTLGLLQKALSGESNTTLSYEARYAAEYLRTYLRVSPDQNHEVVQSQLAILKKHFNDLSARTASPDYSSDLFEEAVKLWNYWGHQSEIRNEIEAGLNSIYSVVEELETNGKALTSEERAVVNSFGRLHRLTLALFASNRLVARKVITVYTALSDTIELIKVVGYESQINKFGHQGWAARNQKAYLEVSIDDFL